MGTKTIRLPKHIRNWKILSAIGLGLIMAIWGLTAFGAWLFIKYRRGYPEVRFADICLPHRWSLHQQRMGDFYVSRAKLFLQEGDYAAAGEYLRSGVTRSPGNLEGQVLLAEFYGALGRPDLAKSLWSRNFDNVSRNPIHLQTALSFLLSIQEDQLVLEKAAPLLNSSNTKGDSAHILLATYGANAAFNLGDLDTAEQLVNQFLPSSSPSSALILARIEWERGYTALALQNLRTAIAQNPREDVLRALEVSFLRQLRLTDEWSTAVIERIVASPDQVEAHIEYFHLLRTQGKEERELAEAEKSIHRFRENSAALLALADFAAKTGQPSIAEKIQPHLSPGNPLAAPVSLMLVEAHVMAGNFQTALSLSADYTAKWPAMATQHAAVLHGLLAIAYNGLGKKDEAQLQLGLLFNERNLRAENLIAISSQLMTDGSRDLALETLLRAVKADPRNEAALMRLIQTQLEMDDVAGAAEFLPQYLAVRRPSRDLAAQIVSKLGSDRYLLIPQQATHLASLQAVLASRTR